MTELTTAQRDRACGVLLGTAAGDALGAGYEFGSPLGADAEVAMKGGGAFGWAPGEWTDDTAMAIAIAEVAATGADLRDAAAQDAIVARWLAWAEHPKDIGNQTRLVLAVARQDGSAASAARAARELHERTGHTAGNGSLMRTAPVVLAHLHDEAAMAEAAQAISALTHFDPEAGEACVLWCAAIRHAVHNCRLDVRRGLRLLSPDRRAVWTERLDVAERSQPSDFRSNGWVVEALQGAWSAIVTSRPDIRSPAHLRRALEAAVRGGGDTDTVAAIAGGLLGAAYGASAVPAEWRRALHGWPGITAHGLVAFAGAIERGGAPDPFDYTFRRWGPCDQLARHPYDEHVWLGGIGALRNPPAGVDGVVSLCRVGDADVPHDAAWVEVRLIDEPDPDENPNLEFVLADTVEAICQMRREGRTVLVHCVKAESRTPVAAALYGMRLRGVSAEQALSDVAAVLPGAHVNPRFRQALKNLERTG